MEIPQSGVTQILDKVMSATATDSECALLLEMLQNDHSGQTLEMINQYFESQNLVFKNTSPDQWKSVLTEIINTEGQNRTQNLEQGKQAQRIHLYRWKWIAASVLLCIITAASLYFIKFNTPKGDVVVQVKDDKAGSDLDIPAPQTNRASVTMADGSVIYLDSINGDIPLQNGYAQIVKTGEDHIVYRKSSLPAKGQIQYNTFTNPKGSKVVEIVLSDNSHIWLNAGSTLVFPDIFAGAERDITLKGEAYFSVTKDSQHPFVVNAGDRKIKVLGTEFNVSAYPGEKSARTTLVTGVVRIESTNKAPLVLKPGQQAIYANTGSIKVKSAADIHTEIAWKSGQFSFKNASLEEIMNQLSRWYGIDVSYANGIPAQHFDGEISRQVKLSQVLKILELGGVRFKLEEEKKLIVL